MACFLVSAAEAAVVKVVEKAEEKKELAAAAGGEVTEASHRIPLSRKLRWLSNMLWGGVVLLLFEHVWHGEVVPFFPFLTAMADASDTANMRREMATVGVGMAAVITAVWAVMCVACDAIARRGSSETEHTAA